MISERRLLHVCRMCAWKITKVCREVRQQSECLDVTYISTGWCREWHIQVAKRWGRRVGEHDVDVLINVSLSYQQNREHHVTAIYPYQQLLRCRKSSAASGDPWILITLCDRLSNINRAVERQTQLTKYDNIESGNDLHHPLRTVWSSKTTAGVRSVQIYMYMQGHLQKFSFFFRKKSNNQQEGKTTCINK